jgi:hypothetical protein
MAEAMRPLYAADHWHNLNQLLELTESVELQSRIFTTSCGVVPYVFGAATLENHVKHRMNHPLANKRSSARRAEDRKHN